MEMHRGIEEWLSLLACPGCKGTLDRGREEGEFCCMSCGLVFGSREGIPVLLLDEARPLREES